ncbi:MAG: hypothetical protein FWE03_02185 [Firmicutes bacterium]|nr:hypothetical protein [Bacillota bacterium]
MKNAIKIFNSMLFPENIKCIVCDAELNEDIRENICKKCSLILNTSFCLICGRAMNHKENSDDYKVIAITKNLLGFGFSEHWIRVPISKKDKDEDRLQIDYETDFEYELGIDLINEDSLDPLQEDNEQEKAINVCHNCARYSPVFYRARSSFIYKSEITALVYRFKYGNNKYLGKHFALFMMDTFNQYIKEEFDIDFISFVPMTKSRQKIRGYNQAQVLAKELSILLNIDLINLFNRNETKKENKNAAKLTKKERQEFIKGSININNDIDKALLKEKTILLIDDVFTTGTTSNECAKKLKQTLNIKTIVLTLAAATA